MTILEPGSFRVSDHRREISLVRKLAVLIRQDGKDPDGTPFTEEDALKGNIQFDHRPPLQDRPYDTETGDFVPPQSDIATIFARRRGKHLELTTGRKEGAEKTVTTRGSDQGERARTRDIRASEAEHKAKLAAKGNVEFVLQNNPDGSKVFRDFDPARDADVVGLTLKPDRIPRRSRIPSRPFDQGKRKLQSRNDLRRRKP